MFPVADRPPSPFNFSSPVPYTQYRYPRSPLNIRLRTLLAKNALCAPPDIQWLPTVSFLEVAPALNLTPEANEELLALFFSSINGFTSFIDEVAFRYGMSAYHTLGPAAVDQYTPFLHFAMLAMAAHLTDKVELHHSTDADCRTKGWPYMLVVMQLFNKEVERPTPTTVMALGLILGWMSDSGRVSLSWLYSGERVSSRTRLYSCLC